MAAEMKLLLIAGMGESVALARDLAALPSVEVVCVRQGRAVARAAPPVKTHEGGFATDADFAGYLRDEGFDFVVDAAHPFQSKLGDVARASGLPYLRALRAPWVAGTGDNWVSAPDMGGAVDVIQRGATVFVVTGRGTLAAFKERPDLTVYCRQLDHHDQEFPLGKGRYIFGQGPFAVDSEIALFKMLGINDLVLRNSGSLKGSSKLEAARAFGARVVMIDPPSLQIDTDQAVDISEIVERVRAYADH